MSLTLVPGSPGSPGSPWGPRNPGSPWKTPKRRKENNNNKENSYYSLFHWAFLMSAKQHTQDEWPNTFIRTGMHLLLLAHPHVHTSRLRIACINHNDRQFVNCSLSFTYTNIFLSHEPEHMIWRDLAETHQDHKKWGRVCKKKNALHVFTQLPVWGVMLHWICTAFGSKAATKIPSRVLQVLRKPSMKWWACSSLSVKPNSKVCGGRIKGKASSEPVKVPC